MNYMRPNAQSTSRKLSSVDTVYEISLRRSNMTTFDTLMKRDKDFAAQ